MNLQESIRRILREESDSGKYLKAVKVIVDDFKNRDFVCDIDVTYYAEYYKVIVVIDNKNLETNFEKESLWYATGLINQYLVDLRDDIRSEILDLLPVNVLISFRRIPHCGWEPLNESENKKSSLLSNIEENGLYEFIKMTGLSLPQIKTKIGELPRQVFETYIKDFINEEGYHQTNGSVLLRYEVEIGIHVYTELFYMVGDRVTVEIRRFDNRGHQTEGYIESMLNLTDEEIFKIAEDMINWGPLTDYEI